MAKKNVLLNPLNGRPPTARRNVALFSSLPHRAPELNSYQQRVSYAPRRLPEPPKRRWMARQRRRCTLDDHRCSRRAGETGTAEIEVERARRTAFSAYAKCHTKNANSSNETRPQLEAILLGEYERLAVPAGMRASIIGLCRQLKFASEYKSREQRSSRDWFPSLNKDTEKMKPHLRSK